MVKNGKKLIKLNSKPPRFGSISLVSTEQASTIRKRKITFSFSFFNQVEYCGIGSCSQAWYIGFLKRLKTLGDMTPQQVLEDNRGSDSLRCHPIDWNSKNIPLRKEDLTWLPTEILNNEAEFPMMQFSISAGTGRFVGFFEGDSVFNIVLLDPKHNIQPCKKDNYQIQPTTKGLSQYDELLNKLENIKNTVKSCKLSSCCLHNSIKVGSNNYIF